MKTLEELGISPTPWTACAPTKREVSVVCLKNDKWHSVQDVALCRSDRRNADAQLIAAAPKMYEALREAIIETCHLCDSCSGHPEYECENKESQCYVKKWREVLAEASGEESND